LTVLVVGNLFANQVHAEDVSTLPLTRIDCDQTAMAWDENANVCGAAWGHVWDQPLTRQDCDKADLTWNDSANVCGTASQMAEAIREIQDAQSEAADTLGQPLTRHECDKAGMAWEEDRGSQGQTGV
jgi:hypothetical protein